MLSLTHRFRMQIKTSIGYRFSLTKLEKIRKKLIMHSVGESMGITGTVLQNERIN